MTTKELNAFIKEFLIEANKLLSDILLDTDHQLNIHGKNIFIIAYFVESDIDIDRFELFFCAMPTIDRSWRSINPFLKKIKLEVSGPTNITIGLGNRGVVTVYRLKKGDYKFKLYSD